MRNLVLCLSLLVTFCMTTVIFAADKHKEKKGGKDRDKVVKTEKPSKAARDVEAEEVEVEIPLSVVPKKVIAAAKKAAPGIKLTEAEVEIQEGEINFTLEGTVKGEEVEVEVAVALKVVGTEIDEDDDDDDDDDEDGDEEDDEDDDDDEEED